MSTTMTVTPEFKQAVYELSEAITNLSLYDAEKDDLIFSKTMQPVWDKFKAMVNMLPREEWDAENKCWKEYKPEKLNLSGSKASE